MSFGQVGMSWENGHQYMLGKARNWSDNVVRGLYAAAMSGQGYMDSKPAQVQLAKPFIMFEMQRRGFMVSAEQCMVRSPGYMSGRTPLRGLGEDISPMHKAAMVGGGLLLAGSVALNFWYYTRWQPKR